MTAWTTISNALVAVGAKPFATTVQALRDNPIAIAEGDPAAHAAGVAIRAAAMRGASAGSEVSKTILGTFDVSLNKTNAVAGSLANGPVAFGPALTALRAGGITVSAQIRRTTIGTVSAAEAIVDVYKNGVSVLTLTGTTATYATYTGNVTFAAGDVIEFGLSTNGSTTGAGGQVTGYARQVKCLADVASFWCI